MGGGRIFHAQPNPEKKPYTIVFPPPNVTGQLHMGHAMNGTLQDILIRWRRMQGYETLWLPGTDHASIATEAKIVEALKEEGLTKEQIGREGFLKRAWEWTEKYGGTIVSQLKKLGCSFDWQRQRFTLDEGCSKAVREVFVRLYEQGKIYRGERIINWCPTCCTSLSDIEVDLPRRKAISGICGILFPTAAGTSVLPPPARKPCWAIRQWPCTQTTSGIRRISAKPSGSPWSAGRFPVVADTYVEREFGTVW